MNENTQAILAEIRRAIDSVKEWKTAADPDLRARGAEAWEGADSGWRILACAWPAVEGGRWGFDGTAIRLSAGLIVRLPRDLAELAVVRAKESSSAPSS